jgi:hypothetical protein
MIQQMFFLIVSLLSLTNCKAQLTNKITTMEGYSKKIDSLEVKMLIGTDTTNKKTTWDIYIYNNNNKDSVLIDHLECSKIYQEEQEYISGDVRKHVIIGDVILVDKTIYLMLYNFGDTYLNTYEFIESKKIIKNQYYSGAIRTGSYLNYGHPNYFASIVRITSYDLIIDTSGGTELSSSFFPLLKFNILNRRLTEIYFDEKNIDKYKDTEKLFETLDFNQNKAKVHILIKDILIDKERMTSDHEFKYLGNVDRSYYEQTGNRINTETIYFFYQVNENGINIIRYDNSHNEWLIGDFKEEQIQF